MEKSVQNQVILSKNFIHQGVDIKNTERLRIELGWGIQAFSSAIRTLHFYT